jgi:AraC-like DNA-binding protein
LADALQFEDKRTQTSETLQWRERAEQRLRAGHLTDPSLGEIACSMGMSYSAFRKRFVQMTGKSPGEFRTDEIVLRACSLLLQTNHNLATIAADLGFHDAFHLSKRFKQVVGMSPQDFRRQNRGR